MIFYNIFKNWYKLSYIKREGVNFIAMQIHNDYWIHNFLLVCIFKEKQNIYFIPPF